MRVTGEVDAPLVAAAGATPAWALVLQADAFWGMSSTRDQWNAPVTDAWTWVSYDDWQLPRNSAGIVGVGAFLSSAAAGTVAAGSRIWQDIDVPDDGVCRIYLRVLDFRAGQSSVSIEFGEDRRTIAWGYPSWARPLARGLARLRRLHDLVSWIDAGVFRVGRGMQRLTVRAETIGQPNLLLDALFLTGDATKPAPASWNPLAYHPDTPEPPAKRERTMISAARIETARRHAASQEWAREQARDILAKADRLASRSDEALWKAVPSSAQPRTPEPPAGGCPLHKGAAFRAGKPWRIDPVEHPGQLQCPVGGEWHPGLLGGHERESGDVLDGELLRHHGRIRSYYAHRVYVDWVRPSALSLRDAHLLTGEARYAHAAGILLSRLASEYPNGLELRNRAEKPPYGGSSGTYLNNVWAAEDGAAFSTTYDAIFAAIDRDSRLVEFVGARLAGIRTGADVRWLIEERLLRTIALAVMDGAINANPGLHDRGLMAVALCLDDLHSGRYPDSGAMVEWLYWQQGLPTGGWSAPRRFLSNTLLPDGCTPASVDYNSLVLAFVDAGRWMEGLRERHPGLFPQKQYPSLLTHPRLRQHVQFLTDLVCLDRYHPAIGDGHGKRLWEGDNLRPQRPSTRIASLAYMTDVHQVFKARPDAGLARVIARQAAFDGRPHRDLFEDSLDADVRRFAGPEPATPPPTVILDDYGVALLRSGQGEHQRVLWINYAGLHGDHRDSDRFNIGLFAHGLDLLPELPYPGSFGFDDVLGFERHPLLHNTVTFDRAREGRGLGQLMAFQGFADAQIIQVASPADRKADRERVRRTCALVDVGERDAYIVDITEAIGGTEHHLGLHGPQAPSVAASGVSLSDAPGALVASTSRLHPFSCMSDVRQGHSRGPYRVDWDLGDDRGTRLRVHALPEVDAMVTMATATPPAEPAPYTVRRWYEHRSGPAPLRSVFARVLEPYAGTPFIDRVEEASLNQPESRVGTRALSIFMGDRVDLFVTAPAGPIPSAAGLIETDARIALVTTVHGALARVRLVGATRFDAPGLSMRIASSSVHTTIEAVDRAAMAIVVRTLPPTLALVGCMIRVFNDRRSHAYRVTGTAGAGAGRLALTLERDAMLAEGLALGFEDGAVLNRVPLPNVTAGCCLEIAAGRGRFTVVGVGAVGHMGADVLVTRPDGTTPSRAALQGAFTERAFEIHGYGPGDSIEITSAVEAWRAPRGPWVIVSAVHVDGRSPAGVRLAS